MSQSEIRIASGLGMGQRFPIATQGRVIGRAPTADVRVRDGEVSDHHAMVVSKDGRDFVYDLGSDTGTFLNESRVDQAELQPGDVIRVGQVHIEYMNPNAPRVSVVQPYPDGGSYAPPPGRGGYSQPPPSRSPSPQPAAPHSPSTAPGAGALVPANPMAMHAQLLLSQMALMQQQAQMNAMNMQQLPLAASNQVVEEAAGPAGPSILDRLKQVYEFYKPYLAFVGVMAVLGLGVGVSSMWWMPPERRASFEVNLISTMADNPVKAFERGLVEFFRAAHISFKSPALIEKTLAALGEVDISPGRIGGIQGSLSLDGIAKLGSTITYQGRFGPGPAEWPLTFLGAHVRLFLDTEIDKTLKQIRVEVDFLEKQLAENEKELRRTEREVLEFKTRNIDGLPDQAKQYYDLLFELQRQQVSAESEISRIKSLQRVDRVRLSAEAPMTEARVSSSRPYQSKIVEINSRLASERAQNKDDAHPDIMRLKNELEQYQRLDRDQQASSSATDVERRRNTTYTAIQDNLRTLDAAQETAYSEMGRLRREMERVKGVVEKLPELDAQYAGLQRSYETSRKLHNDIFSQLKATRLQYDLEKASAKARYDIISPPALDFISPAKVGGTRGAGGLAGGAVLALLIATGLRVRSLKKAAAQATNVTRADTTTTALAEVSTNRWPYRSQP